jgi:predicted nucleotidyltransferase
MATRTSRIASVIRRYVEELGRNGIPVQEAYLFGSYAQGRMHEASDIDIAVISEKFTGDRYADRRKIVPLRRAIDSRIEPIPFRPDVFGRGGVFIDEIKAHGIRIDLR